MDGGFTAFFHDETTCTDFPDGATCGDGTGIRKRTCTNPEPANCGDTCTGATEQNAASSCTIQVGFLSQFSKIINITLHV